MHHAGIDAAIVAREMAFESGDGASPALGAKIVARAWTDPEFKARLVDDGTATAVGVHPETMPMAVMEDTPDVHHMIVCTLCSCYPGRCSATRPPGTSRSSTAAASCASPAPCWRSSGWSSADDVEVRVD